MEVSENRVAHGDLGILNFKNRYKLVTLHDIHRYPTLETHKSGCLSRWADFSQHLRNLCRELQVSSRDSRTSAGNHVFFSKRLGFL